MFLRHAAGIILQLWHGSCYHKDWKKADEPRKHHGWQRTLVCDHLISPLQSLKFEHTRWFCSMDSKSLANKTWDPIQCYPNGAKVCKSLNISIFSKLNSIFWHSKTFQTRAGSLQKGYPLHQSYKKIKNACPWKPFHPFKSWFIRRISQSMPFGFPKKTRNAQFSHRDPSPPSQQLPTRFIQTFVRSDLADDSGRPPLSACLPGISKICHSNWNN